MAGIIKVDRVQSDSNLAFNIAGANVAFMDASALRMVGSNVSLNNTNVFTSGRLTASATLAGSVIQTLYQTTNVNVNLTNGVWVSSGLTCNITSKFLNSTFLLMATVGYNLQSIPSNGISFRFTRGGSGIWTQGQTRYSGISSTGDNEGWCPMKYIDTPNQPAGTTITYNVEGYAHASAGRFQDATESTLIVMEIAP